MLILQQSEGIEEGINSIIDRMGVKDSKYGRDEITFVFFGLQVRA
jgi:hypothetical protein